jgi:hypothetical protein
VLREGGRGELDLLLLELHPLVVVPCSSSDLLGWSLEQDWGRTRRTPLERGSSAALEEIRW